jgi:hypothetical protein
MPMMLIIKVRPNATRIYIPASERPFIKLWNIMKVVNGFFFLPGKVECMEP